MCIDQRRGDPAECGRGAGLLYPGSGLSAQEGLVDGYTGGLDE